MTDTSLTRDLLARVRETRNYNEFINLIPYAKTLGTECIQLGEKLVFKMPARDTNVGNPFLPALHGGSIGGFMEISALLYVMLNLDTPQIPKVINFAIDYVRAGRLEDTFAECELVRQGRKIANVSITAWQVRVEEPIATARVHFLLPDSDA